MDRRFLEDAEAARKALALLPRDWDGRKCVLELKAEDYQWRQMEWIGWYFEMMCRRLLPTGGFAIPGDRVGNITFDGRRSANWDFKAHAVKTQTHLAVLNDVAAMDESVRRHGWHGVIVALLDCEYNDTNRSFQEWHTQLKGGHSKYEKARIVRTAISRYRKTCATLAQILFIGIDADHLDDLSKFRQGRNSNGNPRAPKYMIDLEDLDDLAVLRWPERDTLNPEAAPPREPTADD